MATGIYDFMLAGPWARLRATSSTDGSFTAKIPTATEPSVGASTGVIAAENCANLNLLFFGIGSNNHTFEARIIGWHSAGDGGNKVWFPIALAKVTVTLSSTLPGIGSRAVASTELFADTITVDKGVALVSTAEDDAQPVYLTVPLVPCKYVEVIFKKGSGTDCNALYAFS